jgi:hypothetical protein
LRIITRIRMTRSATLLVASRPGQVQEGKQVRTFVAQVLGQTLIGPIALAAGQQAASLVSSRSVAVHIPCSEIFFSR